MNFHLQTAFNTKYLVKTGPVDNQQKLKYTMRFKIATIGRFTAVLAFLFFTSFIFFNQTAKAQQMVVDDATVLIDKPLNFEAWYGTEESWVQAGYSLNHLWDFTPGVIFNSSDDGNLSGIFSELKYIPTDLEFDGYSYGWAGTIVFDTDGKVDRVFSYIPFTKQIFDGESLVHLNVGFDGKDNINGDWEYGFTTGIRGDFGLTNRFMILSEVFTTDFETPSFQAGLRIGLVPDLLVLDVTYGEGIEQEVDFPGFNVGISFRPNRIW